MAVLCKLITLVVIATGLAYWVFIATFLEWSLTNQVRAAAKVSAGGVGSPSRVYGQLHT